MPRRAKRAPRNKLLVGIDRRWPARPSARPNPEAFERLYDAMFAGKGLEHFEAAVAEAEDVDACHPDGRTLLMFTAMSLDTVFAEVLLRAGADPNAWTKDGYRALTYAVTYEYSDGEVVGGEVDGEEEPRVVFELPVFTGSEEERADELEMLEMLVAAGADLNAADADGGSPLAWAAGNGKRHLVEALLRHGADPDADATDPDHLPRPPVVWAEEAGRHEIAELIRAWPRPGRTPGQAPGTREGRGTG